MNREVQVLVAAMHAEPKELAGRMNLSSDAIIIDQCESFRFYDIDEFYDAVFSAAKKAAKGIKGGIDEVIKNDRGIKNELKEIFIAFYKCYHSPKRLNK